MEDATQHEPPGTRVELKCCQQVEPQGVEEPSVELQCDVDESLEMPEQGSGWVQLEQAARARRKMAIDAFLTSQVKGSKRDEEKQKSRQKIKQALKVLLPAWRKKMQAEGL